MIDIIVGMCSCCHDMYKAPEHMVVGNSYRCERCKNVYKYEPLIMPEFVLTGIHALNKTLEK